uniref:Retrovirus-related Pol polyprotein from transposon TNT 1-94-like beta-barrel domain-containing protein n=1 Tax=Opuntia streptacantha TaxID=393608 RepID=A0A7C9EJX7_OPUST
MMGTLRALRDLKEIAPCPVGLPNGKDTIATKEGTIIVNEDLCLKNVLYVSELTCNLISVSQLTKQCRCFVQFTKTLCVIQGLTLKMLIGVGERRDGLYYFQNTPHINAMKTDCVALFEL